MIAEKDYRETIGEPRHWRLGALRAVDQAHDAGVSAFVGAVRYGEIECLAGVSGPAHHLIASVLLDRDRLTRERGLIEDRKPARHHPVGRDHIALPDQQTIAGHDQVQRDFFQAARAMSNGGSRYPRQQRRHLAARVTFGKRFEELPAGIHQRDDDRGQFLPDDERCCHRQDRNDIEADFTASQTCNNVVNKDDQNRNRERRPDTILPRRLSEQRHGKAEAKTESRQ